MALAMIGQVRAAVVRAAGFWSNSPTTILPRKGHTFIPPLIVCSILVDYSLNYVDQTGWGQIQKKQKERERIKE